MSKKAIILIVIVSINFILMIASLIYIYQLNQQINHKFYPWRHALFELKENTAHAHLWFEEIMGGDQHVKIDSVHAILEKAEGYSSLLLNGGKYRGYQLPPLTSRENKDLALKIEKEIQCFISLVNERWKKQNRASIGSSLDEKQDRIFKRFQLTGNKLESRIENKIYDKVKQNESIHLGIILISMIITILTIVILYEFIKTRRGHIQKLKTQNEDLQTAEEELRALNEELMASNEALKENYEELRTAKQKSKESDKLKSAFLANMSHEIRTPMNAITGFAKLLTINGKSEEKQKMYADLIRKSSHTLLQLINNIMDISKIESGQVQMHEKEIEINSLLTEIHASFKENELLETKNLELTLRLPGENHILVADELRLKQIFYNLLNNALKFTREGSIELGYTMDKRANYTFFVKDTGIGIKPGNQHHVFNRFVKAAGEEEEYPGTGLGLSICQKLVELMGGKIWFTSELEKGTTFYFTLKNSKTNTIDETRKTKTMTRKDEPLELGHLKILVAEDEESNYFLINEILKNEGIQPLWAKDGQEAIDLAREHPEIDCILMDIKMPVKNGFEAFKEIKEIRPGIPVIALTAYAMSGDADKIKAAGFSRYLSKPMDTSKLLRAIHHFTME